MGPVELYPFQKRGVQALRANIAKGIRAQILSSLPPGPAKPRWAWRLCAGQWKRGAAPNLSATVRT